MIKRLFLVLTLLWVSITIVLANDGIIDSWQIVERCLPAPIQPDDNWQFEGEILMRGWAGIHGSPTYSFHEYRIKRKGIINRQLT